MGRLRVNVGVWIVFAVLSAAMANAQLFVPSDIRFNTGRGATTRTYKSSNGAYELTLDQPPQVTTAPYYLKANAAMAKLEGDSRSSLWNTVVEGREVPYIEPGDVYVSDAGDFFLLSWDGARGLTLFRSDKNVRLDDRIYSSDSLFLSLSAGIFAVDDLDGQKIVRVWVRDRNGWHVYRTSDGELIDVSRRPELIAKWNNAVRQEILDRIFAALREALRKKVAKKSAPLARAAATAMGQSTNVAVHEIDYEFLTLLRNPDDRKWIEQLMDLDDERINQLGFLRSHLEGEGFMQFSHTDFLRARADWLLGIWDNKVQRGMIRRDPNSSKRLYQDAPRFNLGRVAGRIQFPGPVNLYAASHPRKSANWGTSTIRVRLIPLGKSSGNRSNTDEINHPLWEPADRDFDVVEEVGFAFTTVRPGRYQLKAIWDKRAPFTNGIGAGPGDYESLLSAPFDVKGGTELSNIVLYCTNRVAGGETYYATDELLAHKWKDTGEISQFSFEPDREGRYDLFWRKAPAWIIATNAPPRTNFAQIDSIGTSTFGPVKGSDIARPDSLDIVLRRQPWGTTRDFDGPSDLIVFDEHGCPYRHTFYSERKQSIRYTFQQFPRSAKTWRVAGYSQSYDPKTPDANILFAYTVTNFVQNPRHHAPPRNLPIEINLGPVKMKVLQVGQDFLEPNINAEFFDGEQRTMDWSIREAIAIDEEGNFIKPRAICPEQKSFRVIGRTGRNAPNVTIRLEFTVPRESIR